MRELVDSIAKALVTDPEAVNVTEELDGDITVIKLQVAPEDMGKIIGKQGRIAKALRTVVKAASAKTGSKVQVEII